MVLATRTSAPNTSLAVIRPKPRPDSPTASEISVIMLKSELPHEASNPVSKKAARIHHAARRRGGVAAGGARAAAGQAENHRFSGHNHACGADSMDRRFCAATARTRLDRRPHHS